MPKVVEMLCIECLQSSSSIVRNLVTFSSVCDVLGRPLRGLSSHDVLCPVLYSWHHFFTAEYEIDSLGKAAAVSFRWISIAVVLLADSTKQ